MMMWTFGCPRNKNKCRYNTGSGRARSLFAFRGNARRLFGNEKARTSSAGKTAQTNVNSLSFLEAPSVPTWFIANINQSLASQHIGLE